MTGDPAWYDLNYLGKTLTPPNEIKTVALSVPARAIFQDQCIELVNRCRAMFADATILCTFHHGWEVTENVMSGHAKEMNMLREKLASQGHEVVNLAGDLQHMERVYDKAEIHVGYRLHAHLFFLSHQKPSFLLEEDGRGRGASEALGFKGIPAWSRAPGDLMLAELPIGRHIRSVARKALRAGLRPRADAVEEALALIKEETSNGFSRFMCVRQVIDRTYREQLVRFLNGLPAKRHQRG